VGNPEYQKSMTTTLFKRCIVLAFGMYLDARLPAQTQRNRARQVRRNPVEDRLNKLTQELNVHRTNSRLLAGFLASGLLLSSALPQAAQAEPARQAQATVSSPARSATLTLPPSRRVPEP
jgi:hypothetical protein